MRHAPEVLHLSEFTPRGHQKTADTHQAPGQSAALEWTLRSDQSQHTCTALNAIEQCGAPGRGVLPTVAALAIAEAARQTRSGAQQLAQELVRSREEPSGTVRITASEVVASDVLPPLLAALREQKPGIQIELVATDEIKNLLHPEADIAVRMERPTQGSLIAKNDALVRGFVSMGVPITREHFALRTDHHLTYGRLVAAGDGIGFVAAYNLRYWPSVQPILPMLKIPPLPCWLAVHREIRDSRLVRRVYDFLAQALS